MRRRDFIVLLAGMTPAWPLVVRAQQKAMPVVGYLGSSSRGMTVPNVAALGRGLSETGFVEGKNLTIDYRWANGDYKRLPALAADLVDTKVDVIVTSGMGGIMAARGATSTIPIIFFGGGDLVAAGIVSSLAHPGGNLTGVSIFGRELNPKRFQLLAELIPQAEVIALLVNPTYQGLEQTVQDVQEAALVVSRQLAVLKASTEGEINAAFSTLTRVKAGALVVAADPFFGTLRDQIVALAAGHSVPAIYEWREFAAGGGLASYGPSIEDTWRQVGVYAGRILHGAKPADMPIQQPTRLELVINLRTARTLGVTIPPSLLGRADEVIE